MCPCNCFPCFTFHLHLICMPSELNILKDLYLTFVGPFGPVLVCFLIMWIWGLFKEVLSFFKDVFGYSFEGYKTGQIYWNTWANIFKNILLFLYLRVLQYHFCGEFPNTKRFTDNSCTVVTRAW